jgi:hypothetical protein
LSRIFFNFFLFLFFVVTKSIAQGGDFSIPGGAHGLSDYFRRQELIHTSNYPVSILQQSLSNQFAHLDSSLPFIVKKSLLNGTHQKKGFIIDLLPASVTTIYNTHHPFGWNDGAMIPAKGLQTLVSGGIRVQSGRFSLQLMPQLVYAANPHFETFPTEHFDGYWATYYRLLNNIDMPERFSTVSYKKLLLGQSAIRYQLGKISLGLSNENYWWGPGRFNSLMMSNNAPGFLHFSVNSTQPIQTQIGDFEGQLIAGQLHSSGIFPADTNRYFNGVRLYQTKTEQNRYLAGITLSWKPKWFSGLSLGFAAVSYQYCNEIRGLGDILPPVGWLPTQTYINGKKAVIGSVFARYVMPKDHAEIYLEIARNDRPASPINLLSDVNYPSAFVGGFRKMFPLAKNNSWFDFSVEITQTGLPNSSLVLNNFSFYTHPQVRQGYTNLGQVIGAGLGPGSNSQTFDLSWVKGYNKVGLRIERLARNMDFNYLAFIITRDYTRHWIDLSTELHADWQYQNILFSARTTLTRSLNYQWYVFPDLGYFQNGYDFMNFNGSFSVAYRF